MFELDRERFERIASETRRSGSHPRYNIGTYAEKSVHLALKRYFEEDQDYHEVPVNGYVADIFRDGRICEIETSGFSGLSPKLGAYLEDYRVDLVLPLMAVKRMAWIDPVTSEMSPLRRSPKSENIYDAVFEAVRILPFICHPNLRILIFFLEVEEYRLLDGWSRDRKRGSHRIEAYPVSALSVTELGTREDFARTIPDDLPESFKIRDFAKSIGRNLYQTRGIMKVFSSLGLIEKTGKDGRAIVYSVAKDPGNAPG